MDIRIFKYFFYINQYEPVIFLLHFVNMAGYLGEYSFNLQSGLHI